MNIIPKIVFSQLVTTVRPTVAEVIDEWGPWDCCTALVGMCKSSDGQDWPVAARWKQPRVGTHYLYLAGDAPTLVGMVEPMLYSIVYQGKPPKKVANWPDASQYAYGRDRIRYAIVSPAPAAMLWSRQVVMSNYCVGIATPEHQDAQRLLSVMSTLMRSRLNHERPSSPQIIVVLHDIGTYWERWDGAAKAAWNNLIANGHYVGIHLVATMQYGHLTKWNAPFPPQRLYGALGNNPMPDHPILRGLSASGLNGLLPYEGLVRCGGRIHKFVVPAV